MDGKIHHHLLLLPLGPSVPSEGSGKNQEGKKEKGPQQSVNRTKSPVKDVADPMDCCATCIFLSCLSQASFLWSGLHRALLQLRKPHRVFKDYLLLGNAQQN